MNTEYSRKHRIHHFDSMFFEVKGVRFQIVGTEKKGNRTIDTVKNLESGKMNEMERNILAQKILNAQTKKVEKRE